MSEKTKFFILVALFIASIALAITTQATWNQNLLIQ